MEGEKKNKKIARSHGKQNKKERKEDGKTGLHLQYRCTNRINLAHTCYILMQLCILPYVAIWSNPRRTFERGGDAMLLKGGGKEKKEITKQGWDSVVFRRHRFASIESWNHEKLSPCFLNKPRSRGEGRRFPWRKFRKFIFKGKMSSLFWG